MKFRLIRKSRAANAGTHLAAGAGDVSVDPLEGVALVHNVVLQQVEHHLELRDRQSEGITLDAQV